MRAAVRANDAQPRGGGRSLPALAADLQAWRRRVLLRRRVGGRRRRRVIVVCREGQARVEACRWFGHEEGRLERHPRGALYVLSGLPPRAARVLRRDVPRRSLPRGGTGAAHSRRWQGARPLRRPRRVSTAAASGARRRLPRGHGQVTATSGGRRRPRAASGSRTGGGDGRGGRWGDGVGGGTCDGGRGVGSQRAPGCAPRARGSHASAPPASRRREARARSSEIGCRRNGPRMPHTGPLTDGARGIR